MKCKECLLTEMGWTKETVCDDCKKKIKRVRLSAIDEAIEIVKNMNETTNNNSEGVREVKTGFRMKFDILEALEAAKEGKNEFSK
jgi:hypothetical protein